MPRTDTPLTVTIDRFEGYRAVLLFPGNQTVSVSRRFVPKTAKEGDVLTVELITNEQQTRRQENLARAILEEILRGE